jgi:5-deoxy-glucuronate isomerase
MERTIHHILMEDVAAESLLVTEVVTPAGNWSSYPPHKHDTDDPPRETQLEETYYHRLRDTRGFAMQRVYTSDGSLDETMSVRDGDLVLVPRGFHTVSAAPGYELYYLNVMSGPVRRWCVTFDPEHEWLRR